MTNDPFLGNLLQIALVTADLEPTLDALGRLGLGPFSLFTLGPHNGSDFTLDGEPAEFTIRFALAQAGGVQWEVIQPVSGDSMYSRFLAAGGEGLHHVLVDGNGLPFDETFAGLEERGYTFAQGGKAFDGDVRFAYFASDVPGAPIAEICEFPDGFAIDDHAEAWHPAADA